VSSQYQKLAVITSTQAADAQGVKEVRGEPKRARHGRRESERVA
jgi:hypothetical protein